MENITGFIVEGQAFHYLDKTRTEFRSHSVNNTPFVHQADELLDGGDWVAKATMVYEGVFNPHTNESKPVGRGVPFAEFVASQSVAMG